MAAALLIPATATLLYMLFVIIRPPVWYNPQYAVPLIGMLLGNALNGVTVGVKTFLETVSAERAAIEWALSMGATRFEAMQCAPGQSSFCCAAQELHCARRALSLCVQLPGAANAQTKKVPCRVPSYLVLRTLHT